MTTSSIASPEPTAIPDRPSGRTLALLGISLGYFMVLLDMTVLSVAEPDLTRSFGTSMAGLQWAVTGYTVAFAALLLSAGAVADRFGAHRVFRMGITVFGVGSLLSAAAPSLWTLVLLRAVLGIAAAACVPASMAMIARLYPQPVDRARAVASWAAISGAAVATGPIAGGFLVDLAGWRSIFLINVPLAVVVLIMTAGRSVRCPSGDRPIDWTVQLVACAVLALLTDALIAAGSAAWPQTLWAGAGTMLAVVVFVVLERRSTAPALSPAVLRARGIPAGLLGGAAVNFALTGALFLLPLLFQQQRRLSPIETGLAFLPLTLPFAVNPLVTGRIVARVGARPPVLTGLGLLTAGGGVLGYGALNQSPYAVLAIGLVLSGYGVSLALPALATTVLAAAPEGMAGAAGGLFNATRQVGATLGVALMGAFVGSDTNSGQGAAYALFLSAAVCAAAGLTIARDSDGVSPAL
ncbi:MAG: putative family transrane transporter [Actinomycetia bacterium]|nr:putative family transrane transporter [Actinomycetes bacterium]